MSDKKLDLNRSINIFTDASSTTHNGVVVCSAGFIVVIDNSIRYSMHRIIYNATSNYSEMYAVLMALEYILQMKNDAMNYPIPRINIFSDSQIVIFGLRKWVFSWASKKKCRSDSFMREKKESKLQRTLDMNMFNYAINSIVYNNMHTNLYHVISHKRYNNASDLEKVSNKFLISNKVRINETEAAYLSYYNTYVDNMTRKNLLAVTEDPMFDEIKEYYRCNNSIVTHLGNDVIQAYKTMINKG